MRYRLGVAQASLLALAAAAQPEVPAGLRLVNGDFSDITGLSAHAGAPGWYDGVPVGWQSSATDTAYCLHAQDGATPPTCNVAQLGFLEQAGGVLAEAADAVLTFDVSEPWQLDAALGAAILDGAGKPLAHSSFQAGRNQRVLARNVPAGTALRVQFWALWGTTPGLDNVTLRAYPPGTQSVGPEDPLPAPPAAPGPMGALDALFRDPPNAYRIIQYSDHEGTVLPIAKMREYGIGGVMLFLSRHEYLRNEQAWANLATTIRLAREAGMQVWVADDNGYPSGQAGGRVVEADAALELRCLRALVRRGIGPVAAQIDVPPGDDRLVAAMLYPLRDGEPQYAAGVPVPLGAGGVETGGREGPWELWAFVARVNNDEGSPARGTMAGFGTTGHYPNLLEAAAAERFVELVHAEFQRRLGPLAGKIDVFYTNEPHLGSIWHAEGQRPDGVVYVPWSADLPRRFRAEHGYDLMARLPALFGGNGDEARLTRRHFYATVGGIFSENFSGRIARWAETHGVHSGGHLLMEEHTDMHVINYGNLLRALGDQHVPGCDVPMPDPGSYWDFWTPRLVASAAQLRGRETVSVLIDPIVGRARPALNPVPRRMMRIINMACLMGANQVTSYIPWERYTAAAYRRTNETVGRLGVMLRGARNASQIALYYPIETFQSQYRPSTRNWIDALSERPEYVQGLKTQEEIIRGLYGHGYDFSWLDGEAVLGAQVSGGRLIVGAHEYTTILMPRVEMLSLAVVRRLLAFEASGGRVLWVDAVPHLGDSMDEHAAVRAALAAAKAVTPGVAMGSLGTAFPESFRLRLEAAVQNVLVGRYLRDGHPVSVVVNNQDAEAAPGLRLEGAAAGAVWVYDPATGAIARREVPCALQLAPYSAVFVVE